MKKRAIIITRPWPALNKERIAAILSLLLSAVLFYEGIYKLTDIEAYKHWLLMAPFLFHYFSLFAYLISFYEISLSILLIIPRSRFVGFQMLFWSLIFYIGYIFIGFHRGQIILSPYQSFWPDYVSWTGKMICLLAESAMAFAGILLMSKPNIKEKKQRKTLRNTL